MPFNSCAACTYEDIIKKMWNSYLKQQVIAWTTEISIVQVYNPKPGIIVKLLTYVTKPNAVAVGFMFRGGYREFYRAVDVPLPNCQALQGGCTNKSGVVALAWASLEGWAGPYLEALAGKSSGVQADEAKSLGLNPPAGTHFEQSLAVTTRVSVDYHDDLLIDVYSGSAYIVHAATGERGYFQASMPFNSCAACTYEDIIKKMWNSYLKQQVIAWTTALGN
jgi:hypothetical protein